MKPLMGRSRLPARAAEEGEERYEGVADGFEVGFSYQYEFSNRTSIRYNRYLANTGGEKLTTSGTSPLCRYRTLMYVRSTSHYGASLRRVASYTGHTPAQDTSLAGRLPASATHPVRRSSIPFPSFASSMPLQPCPTVGCSAWTNAPGRWLDPPDSYTLLLDDTKLSLNRRVCNKCWNCHRYPERDLDGRIRKPTLFDQQLQAAANPSQPTLLLSPIKQLTPRRRWTLKEKMSICAEWKDDSTTAEKQAINDKHRAEQLDGHQVQRWRAALVLNSGPKGKKASSGRAASRHHVDAEQEAEGESTGR